jgi:WD40 repeat protein
MSRKSAPTSNKPPLRIPRPLPPITRAFGERRFHADGPVVALYFSSAGELFSVEEPGRLRQWDTITGQPVRSAVLSDLETIWKFSTDGRVVVSASDEVSLWDVATGQFLTALPQSSWVDAVALWSNPAIAATGHDDGVIRLWDVASGKMLRELGGHDRPISVLAYSADGSRLASAGEDRIICIWETATGRHLGTLSRHTDHIQDLAWRPDGKILVSAGWDRTARVWDIERFEPVILLNTHDDQVTALAFSPDGGLLVSADSANGIRVWEPIAGKELHFLGKHDDEVRCLTFNANGSMLASAGADRVIRFWDPHHGRLLSGHGQAVLPRSSIGLLHAGKGLASSCGGGGLQVWHVESGKPCLQGYQSPYVTSLAVSPDGRWLATGLDGRRVQLWQSEPLKSCKILKGMAGEIGELCFSPDSRQLACVSRDDGMIWIWDVATAEPVLVIPLAADACTVESVAYHPHGRLLAAGGIDWLATRGTDGAVCIWDVMTPSLVATLDRGATSLVFHPSGRWLACAGLDLAVRVWDVQAQKPAHEWTGHAEPVTCLAYDPKGDWLVSGSDDETLRIWDAHSGALLGIFELDTAIKAICFSPDGRHLFTSNGNTTSYQIEVDHLADGIGIVRAANT